MKNRNKAKMRKQVVRKGYFKAGDCIEVSGKLFGLVVSADSKIVGVKRFAHSGLGLFIERNTTAYSNEAKHYENSYWIRKVQAPKEYQHMSVGVLSVNL
ncbi:hypothetical protein PGRAN_02465 [Listeria grandensis FSL F6-0971]|uniref:Uncharacterized protein n=1 Tax=Listeria grandensis FSL F6-0971 TaxID=1265819 RepID=W7BFM7_9LIST|nr:hypothetical protein [Listeria grandensis]EUJ24722.1 hypothetical protein PGRAN_02465 [Listeria grandensis FSL F6-0971]